MTLKFSYNFPHDNLIGNIQEEPVSENDNAWQDGRGGSGGWCLNAEARQCIARRTCLLVRKEELETLGEPVLA